MKKFNLFSTEFLHGEGYQRYSSSEAQRKYADQLLNISEKSLLLMFAPAFGFLLSDEASVFIGVLLLSILLLACILYYRHEALKIYDALAQEKAVNGDLTTPRIGGQHTIDHIGVSVADVEVSKAFYTKVLETLGMELLLEEQGWIGFGRNAKPEFWLGPKENAFQNLHIAFVAENRAQVDDFYEVAIAAGGKDNGMPGVREQYHPNYYGAFVIDPDGNNIEAVCHH